MIVARLRRAPSMMLAWFSSSETMVSSRPSSAATVPALAAKPLWKTTAASVSLKRRQPLLQVDVQRHRARDGAHRARADAERLDGFARALAQQRVRGQPEVVVRREVDHRPVIELRPRRLLAVEHAQGSEEPLLAKRRELIVQEAQGVGRHRTGQYRGWPVVRPLSAETC